MRKTLVNRKHICNLGRIPFSADRNPLHCMVKEIIDNPNIKYDNTSLKKHDIIYNPKTISDIYCIEYLSNYSANCQFAPWIHTRPVCEFKDYGFFVEEFGVLEKMKGLIKSVRKNGYVPEMFPDRKNGISGYWLVSGEKRKFYVVSGNHRVAVLFTLFPEKEFRFNIEEFRNMKRREKANNGLFRLVERHPEEFNIKEVDNWPSVRSGFTTKKVATQIFNCYMKD